MFGFSESQHRTAIAVDIGSSSVGVAIVCIHADAATEHIWEHREYSVIHDDATAAKQVRQIKTALANAFLELSQHGLKALQDTGHSTTIDEVQAVVSAPWSYTITKTISLTDEHPFAITHDLIDELVQSAQNQSKLVFATNKLADVLNLEVTHGDVINITVNEYPVTNPFDHKGRSIALSYTETAISRDVTDTLTDTVEKFFPKAKLTQYSFMYVFYLTMRNLQPNTTEICLIDVTGEATEIGIVRNDVLQHTTFAPVGTYSIARELATASDIPKHEAHSYMKDHPAELSERLPKRAQEKVAAVIDEYEQVVANAFIRTGDRLSIPKTVFLHTDPRTEEFFLAHLEEATRLATQKRHTIHPITPKVLLSPDKEDTALLLSLTFLANKHTYFKLLPKEQ